MKTCIVTGNTAMFQRLAELTVPIKAEYAERHGYDFEAIKFPSIHYASQCLALLKVLATGKYDRAFWSGADCLITNLAKPLPDFSNRAPIAATADAHGLNLDVIIANQSGDTANLLYEVSSSFNEFGRSRWVEQDAMNHFRGTERVHFLPQRTMNSYQYPLYYNLGHPYTTSKDIFGNDGQWQKGDFILHVPAIPLEQRECIIRNHLTSIVR